MLSRSERTPRTPDERVRGGHTSALLAPLFCCSHGERRVLTFFIESVNDDKISVV